MLDSSVPQTSTGCSVSIWCADTTKVYLLAYYDRLKVALGLYYLILDCSSAFSGHYVSVYCRNFQFSAMF